MTVRELIEKLQAFDPRLPVVCGEPPNSSWDCGETFSPLPRVESNVRFEDKGDLAEAVVL